MSNIAVRNHGERRGRSSPSLRYTTMVIVVSNLKREAAMKATEKWGQRNSKMTHLIFKVPSSNVTFSSECYLPQLHSLRLRVEHISYNRDCFNGNNALGSFEDLAKRNPTDVVLLVCSEVRALTSRDLTPVPLTFREPRLPIQRAIAPLGVNELQERLEAAQRKLETERKAAQRKYEEAKQKYEAEQKADRILLKLKTNEANTLRSVLGLPQEIQLKARTHRARGTALGG